MLRSFNLYQVICMSYYGNGRSLSCYMQMAIIPRPPVGHGWLRPAIGVMELSQSVVQVRFSREPVLF